MNSGKVAVYKTNIQKYVSLLYTNNELSEWNARNQKHITEVKNADGSLPAETQLRK